MINNSKSFLTNILFLGVFFLSSFTYTQDLSINKDITKLEKTKIEDKLNLIENALKESNTKALQKHLASNFTAAGYSMPISYKGVLPQMFQQLPKGNFKVNKISKLSEEIFSIEIFIMPHHIPLVIELDNDFFIASLNVLNEQKKSNQLDASDNYRIEQEHIILPFSVIDGYIIIDGKVGEINGKFMLDTGNPFGVFLNNNYIILDTNNFFTSGSAGSGQNLELFKSPVKNISVSDKFEFNNLTSVVHADFGFIERGITKNFLGFIGFEFLENYEFVIDYNLQEIHLYLLDSKGNSSMPKIDEEMIVEKFDFNINSDLQIPIVEIISGRQKINLYFDSGALGSLSLTKKSTKRLKKDNNLIEIEKSLSIKKPTIEYYLLRGVRYGDNPIDDFNNLSFSEGKDNRLICGYHFLKNYVSVWNYKKKTLVLTKHINTNKH